MIIKSKSYFLLLPIVISLSGCSVFNYYFPDKSLRYQEQTSRSSIELPEGIQSSKIKDSMPVPDIAASLQNMPLPDKVDRPSPLQIGLMSMGVQKRSTGDKHWLFINRAASQVWPELETYFEANKLSIALSNPRLGEIESDMETGSDFLDRLVNSSDTEAASQVKGIQRYRFKLKLQPGLQRNTSRLELVFSSSLGSWSDSSENLEAESLIIDDLANFLGGQLEKQSSVSLLAQEMTRDFEVKLVNRDSQQVHLFINQDFNKSWYLLGKAIRANKMPLFDINRSLGSFYLSTGHKEAGGFEFTNKIKRNSHLVNLKEHGDFQIYVLEVETGTEVRVRLSDAKGANPVFSEFVLEALLKTISSEQDS